MYLIPPCYAATARVHLTQYRNTPSAFGSVTLLQTFIINMFVTSGGPAVGGGSDVPVPDPGGLSPDGGEEALRLVLRHMFVIVAGLVLLDGVQTILSGVIQVGAVQCRHSMGVQRYKPALGLPNHLQLMQPRYGGEVPPILDAHAQGCGQQRAGALVNLVAFCVFAVPLALGLAFRVQLPGSEPADAAWWGHLLPPGLRGVVVGMGMGPEGLYLGMIAGPIIQTVSAGKG